MGSTPGGDGSRCRPRSRLRRARRPPCRSGRDEPPPVGRPVGLRGASDQQPEPAPVRAQDRDCEARPEGDRRTVGRPRRAILEVRLDPEETVRPGAVGRRDGQRARVVRPWPDLHEDDAAPVGRPARREARADRPRAGPVGVHDDDSQRPPAGVRPREGQPPSVRRPSSLEAVDAREVRRRRRLRRRGTRCGRRERGRDERGTGDGSDHAHVAAGVRERAAAGALRRRGGAAGWIRRRRGPAGSRRARGRPLLPSHPGAARA